LLGRHTSVEHTPSSCLMTSCSLDNGQG
jgi:hypothetical protein